eukprot:5164789-Amphidinium_carterae.1
MAGLSKEARRMEDDQAVGGLRTPNRSCERMGDRVAMVGLRLWVTLLKCLAARAEIEAGEVEMDVPGWLWNGEPFGALHEMPYIEVFRRCAEVDVEDALTLTTMPSGWNNYPMLSECVG